MSYKFTEVFKNRHEIIEFLYSVKDKIDFDNKIVSEDYINQVFNINEEVIRKSKYCDKDVLDLIDDLEDSIVSYIANKTFTHFDKSQVCYH
jgi:hypothetical protein